MPAIIALRSSARTVECPKCGDRVISPEQTYDFPEEGIVVNFWSCGNCGNQFETDTKMEDQNSQQDSKEVAVRPLLVA